MMARTVDAPADRANAKQGFSDWKRLIPAPGIPELSGFFAIAELKIEFD